jgi:hypothetical protein
MLSSFGGARTAKGAFSLAPSWIGAGTVRREAMHYRVGRRLKRRRAQLSALPALARGNCADRSGRAWRLSNTCFRASVLPCFCRSVRRALEAAIPRSRQSRPREKRAQGNCRIASGNLVATAAPDHVARS